MKNQPKIKWEKEFDEEFVFPNHDSWVDKVINRSKEYIEAYPPRPSDIKSFIQSKLKELLGEVEKPFKKQMKEIQKWGEDEIGISLIHIDAEWEEFEAKIKEIKEKWGLKWKKRQKKY